MAEKYRKTGRTVRYESGRIIHVTEAGEATEDGASFTCRPSGASVDLPDIDVATVRSTAKAIESLASKSVRVERCVVADGVAKHSFEDVKWTDRSKRVHAALTTSTLRALVDLGDFDVQELAPIVEALGKASAERAAPQRIRLRQNVAAALLPALIGAVPPNVTMHQTAGGFDGKGVAVEDRVLTLPPWPNWYRPTYRTRPVRTPLNIRLESSVTEIDDTLPQAIALLAPLWGAAVSAADLLSLRVLVVERDGVYPATIHVTRIESVATKRRWYPYGAGSFGAEMVL